MSSSDAAEATAAPAENDADAAVATPAADAAAAAADAAPTPKRKEKLTSGNGEPQLLHIISLLQKRSGGSAGRATEGRRCSTSGLASASSSLVAAMSGGSLDPAREDNNNDSGKAAGGGLLDQNSLQLPAQHRRKFSFPASLHSNLLGLAEPTVQARRRFSNVSDVVTRKFSNTIGWRSSVPVQEIAAQGRTLCGQYIRCRLKRAGLFSRKCGLQRLRSAASLASPGGGYVVREVFPEMNGVGQELERMHPKLYAGVARQASATPGGGVLATDKAVHALLASVARELIRSELTWAKVVSLYAVAGGLAVDCVRQGHPDYLQAIIESMGEILEEELAAWIGENGGWSGLLTYCKPPTNDFSLAATVSLVAAVVLSTLLLILLLRWFGRFALL